MLEIRNVTIKFEELVLVCKKLDIPEKAITLIRGVSGSGKTSLLYRIGLISHDINYQYIVDGRDIVKMNEYEKSLF